MSRCHVVVYSSLVALAVSGGCSSGSDDESVGELFPVSGMVTLDGKPLSGATVSFSPMKGTQGSRSEGTTDANGEFILRKRNGRKGLEAGKYQVAVSKFAQKDGTPFPTNIAGDVRAAVGVEHVPERYVRGESAELVFEVPKGGTKLEIALTTKPPAAAPSGMNALMPK